MLKQTKHKGNIIHNKKQSKGIKVSWKNPIDYFTFGMVHPAREYSILNYDFAFNGKIYDDEIYGNKNLYDFGNRFYDPRLGRLLSLDKFAGMATDQTPFGFANNNPVFALDREGDTTIFYTENGEYLYTTPDKLPNAVVFVSDVYRNICDMWNLSSSDPNVKAAHMRFTGLNYWIDPIKQFYEMHKDDIGQHGQINEHGTIFQQNSNSLTADLSIDLSDGDINSVGNSDGTHAHLHTHPNVGEPYYGYGSTGYEVNTARASFYLYDGVAFGDLMDAGNRPNDIDVIITPRAIVFYSNLFTITPPDIFIGTSKFKPISENEANKPASKKSTLTNKGKGSKYKAPNFRGGNTKGTKRKNKSTTTPKDSNYKSRASF